MKQFFTDQLSEFSINSLKESFFELDFFVEPANADARFANGEKINFASFALSAKKTKMNCQPKVEDVRNC